MKTLDWTFVTELDDKDHVITVETDDGEVFAVEISSGKLMMHGTGKVTSGKVVIDGDKVEWVH